MREGADGSDEGNACHQPNHLQCGRTGTHLLLQLGDQIGQRNINEAAAGQGQKIRQEAREVGHQPPTGKPAQGCERTGKRNLDEGGTPTTACSCQNDQIADMVRNLMGQDGQGRHHAQARVGCESGRDEHAVAKAMNAVSRQQAPAASRMGVMSGVPLMQPMGIAVGMVVAVIVTMGITRLAVMMFMTVMPQLCLIKQKEKHQACEQNEEKDARIGALLESLRQQMHEGSCQ